MIVAMRIFAPMIALGLCACGGAADVLVDAGMEDGPRPADVAPDADYLDDDCLPTSGSVANGFMVLGTGRSAFEAMPTELPLEYGFQGGFDVVANLRMLGFSAGNRFDILDPSNPRTYIRATFADSNIPVMSGACFRVPYKVSPLGGYEIDGGLPIVFNTCWRSDQLIGQRLRIDAYISNPERGTAFAHDAKIVTMVAPPDGTYPIEDGSPPCTTGPVEPPPVTPLAMPPVPEIRWAP
jgi:hypothetical protein